MCTQYWNLKIEYNCPMCDSSQAGELQTHFMGQDGSFLHYYGIGQPVDELKGVDEARLGEGSADNLLSICGTCHGSIDWGARIEGGAVIDVWPYRWSNATI